VAKMPTRREICGQAEANCIIAGMCSVMNSTTALTHGDRPRLCRTSRQTICALTSSGHCQCLSRPAFPVVRISSVASLEKLLSLVHGKPITDQGRRGNVGAEHRL